MINVEDNFFQSEGLGLKGFGVTSPAPFVLEFAEGRLIRKRTDKYESPSYSEDGMLALEYREVPYYLSDLYSPFELQIVPDPDFDVIYDIYLIEQPSETGESIQIDRVEIGVDFGQFAFYKGTDKMIHCAYSIQVPAGASSLLDCRIVYNNVELVEHVQG